MSEEFTDEAYYELSPEQGLCLIGDAVINLGQVALIRKLDGKTLVYYSGATEPVIFPSKAFDRIREIVFAIEDDEDEDEDDDEE